MTAYNMRPFTIPTQETITIDDQDTPGGAALHLVANPQGEFYFAANNSTSGNVAFTTSSGLEVTVVHNADPVTNLGGKPVYAIEANDGLHTMLACVTLGGLATGAIARVNTLTGAQIEVAIVASISGYIAVAFKDDAATASLRLRATTAGNADITFKTSPRYSRDVVVIP